MAPISGYQGLLILSIIIGTTLASDDVTLSNNLFVGNITCVGRESLFTCTVGGTIISWCSNDYMEPGECLQFSQGTSPGQTKTSSGNSNTIATLLDASGNGELTSQLRITPTLALPTSTITCRNNDEGTSRDVMFTVLLHDQAPCTRVPTTVGLSSDTRVTTEHGRSRLTTTVEESSNPIITTEHATLAPMNAGQGRYSISAMVLCACVFIAVLSS